MKRLLTTVLLVGLAPMLVACGDEPLGTGPSTAQDAQPVATEEPTQAPEPTQALADEAQAPAPTKEPTPTAPPAPTVPPAPSPTPTEAPAEPTLAPPTPARPTPTAAPPPPPPPTPTRRPAVPTPSAQPTATPAPTAAPEPEVTPEVLFIEVASLEDESTVDASPLSVEGETTPDAVLSINGESVEVDADGKFSAEVELVEGINFIEIVASDFDGNSAEVVRTLIYSPKRGQ